MCDMGMGKSNKVFMVLLVVVVALALCALPGCSKLKEKVKDKAADAAEVALDAVEKGAEIAGEATANWLGTTAGNVGKNFNETIKERFAYLEISVDAINIIEPDAEDGEEPDEAEDGVVLYSINLTINNTAPDTEKMYIHILLGDHYLIACDRDDYTYSLSADRSAGGYSDQILPGKSKLTVRTELSEPDEISYLLFIGNKITLP